MSSLAADVKKAYETVSAFVARTGGDNSNGRISKSFFPDRKAPVQTQAAPDRTGWSPARSTNPQVMFEACAANAFIVDTTAADETRHCNIERVIDRIPPGAAYFALSVTVRVERATRLWPKLVAVLKLTATDEATRTDKEAVPLTKTVGETSQHRICFAVKPGEEKANVVLHIPKDCGVRLFFSETDVRFLDAQAEPLDENAQARPAQKDLEALRPFRLVGTADITPLQGQNIDMIAGCETSYISAYLKELGIGVTHSFEHHRAMDPYTELMPGNSPYLTSDAPHLILSQVQVLRPMITKLERAAGLASRVELEEWIDATIDALRWSITQIRAQRTCNIWIFTHPGYHTPGMGVFDYRSGPEGWSVYEMLTRYKMALYALARDFARVYVLDVDLALERHGKLPPEAPARIRLHESLGGHLESEGAQIVGEHLIHQMLSLSADVKKIKCVVVDCDNTLWNGVLREDGADRVKLYRPRFHRLWHLSQRGIPIALCSKNDAADTEQILQIVSRYGALKKAIVTTRINWQPKSQNIQSIADELNIGLDTIAFFDDSPFEREQVSAALPEVRVFSEQEICSAPELPIFQLPGDLNADAVARVARYQEDKARKQHGDSFGADRFEDFLMQCDMRLETRLARKDELPRVAEIFQRTNQMNATLKRADLGQVEHVHSTAAGAVHLVKLGDKFGDYGVIGASLCRQHGDLLMIEELALSCRAMGRRVEDALLEELIGHARDLGLAGLQIEVSKTSRNDQIIETLSRVGFVERPDGSGRDQVKWGLDLNTTTRQGRDFAKWFAAAPIEEEIAL